MTNALAKCFAKAGHNVFIGNNGSGLYDESKYDNISHTTVENAAMISDLVIVTAPMEEVRDIAYRLGDIRRKVVLDATSLGLTRFGQYVKTYDVLRAITGCQHIVKCYNKTGFEDLVEESLESRDVDVFMAGDSKKAKELTKLLARDLEIGECYDFGGCDMIPTLDEMTMCWQTQMVSDKANTAIAFRQQRG